jgi:hypothetical protein
VANVHPSNEACDARCQRARQICDGNHDPAAGGHQWCIAECYTTDITHILTPPEED